MKNLMILFFSILHFTVIAQKAGEQAIFKECEKEEFSIKCTEDKLKSDIISLLTPQIIAEISKKSNAYYSISLAIVSDENGQINIEESEINCEQNEELKKAIIAYFTALPEFLPKDKKLAERRSLQIITIVFTIADNDSKISVLDERNAGQILSVVQLHPTTSAVYPGCKGINKYALQKCYLESVGKFLQKKYRIPYTRYAGKGQLMITLLLTPAGKLLVENVQGNTTKEYKDEVVRVINKIPSIEPPTRNGIPIPFRIYIPLNLSITQ